MKRQLVKALMHLSFGAENIARWLDKAEQWACMERRFTRVLDAAEKKHEDAQTLGGM